MNESPNDRFAREMLAIYEEECRNMTPKELIRELQDPMFLQVTEAVLANVQETLELFGTAHDDYQRAGITSMWYEGVAEYCLEEAREAKARSEMLKESDQ